MEQQSSKSTTDSLHTKTKRTTTAAAHTMHVVVVDMEEEGSRLHWAQGKGWTAATPSLFLSLLAGNVSLTSSLSLFRYWNARAT